MFEIQRVKCGGKVHRIEWSARGASFLDHAAKSRVGTVCQERFDEWTKCAPQKQIYRWIAAGFTRGKLERADYGYSASVCDWVAAGVTPEDAVLWIAADVWPGEGTGVQVASALGVSASEVKRAQKNGLTHDCLSTLGYALEDDPSLFDSFSEAGATFEKLVEIARENKISIEVLVDLIYSNLDALEIILNSDFISLAINWAEARYPIDRLGFGRIPQMLLLIKSIGLTHSDFTRLSKWGAFEFEALNELGLNRRKILDWFASGLSADLVIASVVGGRSVHGALKVRAAVEAVSKKYGFAPGAVLEDVLRGPLSPALINEYKLSTLKVSQIKNGLKHGVALGRAKEVYGASLSSSDISFAFATRAKVLEIIALKAEITALGTDGYSIPTVRKYLDAKCGAVSEIRVWIDLGIPVEAASTFALASISAANIASLVEEGFDAALVTSFAGLYHRLNLWDLERSYLEGSSRLDADYVMTIRRKKSNLLKSFNITNIAACIRLGMSADQTERMIRASPISIACEDLALLPPWFEAGFSCSCTDIDPETASEWACKGYDLETACFKVERGVDVKKAKHRLAGQKWSSVFARVNRTEDSFYVREPFKDQICNLFDEIGDQVDVIFKSSYGPEEVYSEFGYSSREIDTFAGYEALRFTCARLGLTQPKFFKGEAHIDLEAEVARWIEPIKLKSGAGNG